MTALELYNDSIPKFEEFKSKMDSMTDKVVWTNGQYFNIEPYGYERAGFKRRKILKMGSESPKSKFCYLFDSNDKLICKKTGINSPNDPLQHTFYEYHDSYIHSFLYGNTGTLINARILSLSDDGKVVKMDSYAQLGKRIELYNYEGDILREIDVTQSDDSTYKVFFEYDSEGNVLRIKDVHPNGYEEVRYK